MNSFMTGASWLFRLRCRAVVALVVAGAVWWFIKKVMDALCHPVFCSAFGPQNSFIIATHDVLVPRSVAPDHRGRLLSRRHATAVTALTLVLVPRRGSLRCRGFRARGALRRRRWDLENRHGAAAGPVALQAGVGFHHESTRPWGAAQGVHAFEVVRGDDEDGQAGAPALVQDEMSRSREAASRPAIGSSRRTLRVGGE